MAITRIKLRRDTSTNWSNHNPILEEGEVGLELDTKKMKVGDGTHNWNDLPYYNDSVSEADHATNADNADNATHADNADKLENHPASYFATADHNHNLSNLADVDDTNKGDGKVLRWNQSAGRHEYVEMTSGGDMYKSTYDTNNDGIVDRAEKADAITDGEIDGGHANTF